MKHMTVKPIPRLHSSMARYGSVLLSCVILTALVSVMSSVCWSGAPRKVITRKNETPADNVVSAVPTLASGDLYALLVGVSNYKHPRVPALQVSAKDATDLAQFLNSQRELFKNVHITVLTNEQATKSEVEKHLLYELRKAGRDDTTRFRQSSFSCTAHLTGVLMARVGFAGGY